MKTTLFQQFAKRNLQQLREQHQDAQTRKVLVHMESLVDEGLHAVLDYLLLERLNLALYEKYADEDKTKRQFVYLTMIESAMLPVACDVVEMAYRLLDHVIVINWNHLLGEIIEGGSTISEQMMLGTTSEQLAAYSQANPFPQGRW